MFEFDIDTFQFLAYGACHKLIIIVSVFRKTAYVSSKQTQQAENPEIWDREQKARTHTWAKFPNI